MKVVYKQQVYIQSSDLQTITTVIDLRQHFARNASWRSGKTSLAVCMEVQYGISTKVWNWAALAGMLLQYYSINSPVHCTSNVAGCRRLSSHEIITK